MVASASREGSGSMVDVVSSRVATATGARVGWPVAAYVDSEGRQNRSGPLTLTAEQMLGFESARAQLRGVALGDCNRLSDEDLILRFFIARHFDVEKTVEGVQGSVQWRATVGADQIFAWGSGAVPWDIVKTSHQDGVCGFFGVCEEGYPIWWEIPDQKGCEQLLETHGQAVLLKWHHVMMERMREHAKLLGVDRFNCVLDLRAISGRAVIVGKLGEQLKAQTKQDQEVYPECMRRMFIVNAPFGFSAVYSVVKLLLDARVQKKISIDRARRDGDTLSQAVTADNTPKEFGGTATVDWEQCRMVPSDKQYIFAAPAYVDRLRELDLLREGADAAAAANNNNNDNNDNADPAAAAASAAAALPGGDAEHQHHHHHHHHDNANTDYGDECWTCLSGPCSTASSTPNHTPRSDAAKAPRHHHHHPHPPPLCMTPANQGTSQDDMGSPTPFRDDPRYGGRAEEGSGGGRGDDEDDVNNTGCASWCCVVS